MSCFGLGCALLSGLVLLPLWDSVLFLLGEVILGLTFLATRPARWHLRVVTRYRERRARGQDASLVGLAFDAGALRGMLLVFTLPGALALLALAALPIAIGAWLSQFGEMVAEEAAVTRAERGDAFQPANDDE